MENHLHRLLLLLLLLETATLASAQNSPGVVIQDYDNTSLPVTYQINTDTTFCKGRTITIHGQYFKRATSGELWDTTQVFLGGQRIWPQSIVSQMGGTNDRLVLALPSTYMSDTCLRLEIVKRTVLALDTFFYATANTALGPRTSFRCFEFGTVCDPDADPRASGTRTGCRSREDSPYLASVASYTAFLRGLKADPRKDVRDSRSGCTFARSRGMTPLIT